MEYFCAECGDIIERHIKPSYATRVINLYCGRKCANIGLNKNRKGKPIAGLQPPSEKRASCAGCGWSTKDLTKIGEACPICTFYKLEPNGGKNAYTHKKTVEACV